MDVVRIKSITDYHRMVGLPAPEHPLISVIDYAQVTHARGTQALVLGFYSIGIKRDIGGKLHYGQQVYDFDEGIMSFIAPEQVLRLERDPDTTAKPSGYLIQIHPDFLWGTSLAKTIKKYDFFNYAINEALFLSDKEEEILINIVRNIQQEYHANIDKFTQGIIISQLETLLNYAERFYQRQFVTRKITSHEVLDKVESYLEERFSSDDLVHTGLPTVQIMAEKLFMSPVYLSSLLKQLTGQTAQQHIHEKLIEKAKEKLSTSNLSVSEIAYELGFEHSQSFSKLFKAKTEQSPLEFRAAFN